MNLSTYIKLLLLCSANTLLGCNSNQLAEKDKIIAAQQLQIQHLEDSIGTLLTVQDIQKIEEYQIPKSSDIQNKQFYFIVLDVVEDHGTENENLHYTTDINEITLYNEEIKYKLLDKVSAAYKQGLNNTIYHGEIRNRRIFLFDTYEEASKVREKYTMH